LTAPDNEHFRKLGRLTLLTFLFIYIQLILGAAVRHTGKVVYEHMGFALVVVVHVVLVFVRVYKMPEVKNPFRAPAMGLVVLTVFQIVLGLGAFLYTQVIPREGDVPSLPEVVFASAHHTNGALVLGLAALLFVMARPWPFGAVEKR
jgi:heme A synthase